MLGVICVQMSGCIEVQCWDRNGEIMWSVLSTPMLLWQDLGSIHYQTLLSSSPACEQTDINAEGLEVWWCEWSYAKRDSHKQ